MVDMTKHPLHYSRELVMVLLSLDLRPLETVNMIITYSSGLLQKVARGLAFSTMSCGQHPLQGSTLLLSSYRSHLSLRMACGSWGLPAWDDRVLLCHMNKQQQLHSLVVCGTWASLLHWSPWLLQVDVIFAPPIEEGADILIGEWVTDLDQAWVSLTPVSVYVASALYFQKALESSCGYSQHPCSSLAWMFLSGELELQKFHSWKLARASQWPWV